jgi:hypothetical protein
MLTHEKRLNQRYSARVPVRLRCIDIAQEVCAHAVNISHTGLLLISPDKLSLGCVVSMFLRVRTGPSHAFREIQCAGRVIRAQETAAGAQAYGIRIESVG